MGAADQNRALCESRATYELLETTIIPSAAMHAQEGTGGKLDLINVSRVNVVNLNRRVYPGEVMAVAIERCKPLITLGMLGGAVDHPGWGEGALKNSPIIWRELRLNSATGDVQGRPEIVSDHTDGANLLALVRAGRGLPFSTRGMGSAHRPSEDEKIRFNLKPGVDDDVVIIDEGYELRAIDAVDCPSCVTAYLPGTAPPASNSPRENRNSAGMTTEALRRELWM